MKINLKTQGVGCLRIKWIPKYNEYANRPGWLDSFWTDGSSSTFLVSEKYTYYEFLKKAYEIIYSPEEGYSTKIIPKGKYFDIKILQTDKVTHNKKWEVPVQRHLIEVILVPPTNKIRDKIL